MPMPIGPHILPPVRAYRDHHSPTLLQYRTNEMRSGATGTGFRWRNNTVGCIHSLYQSQGPHHPCLYPHCSIAVLSRSRAP